MVGHYTGYQSAGQAKRPLEGEKAKGEVGNNKRESKIVSITSDNPGTFDTEEHR